MVQPHFLINLTTMFLLSIIVSKLETDHKIVSN